MARGRTRGRRGALAVALALAMLVPTVLARSIPARADVTTNSNNLLRNGWYPDQPALSPATVTGGSFGRIFNATVQGQVYAQPIVSRGTLLVATEDNHVYGLDPITGAQKWERTLGTPFNASDISCADLSPHVGITGTPVVDPATNIAYFLDKEYVTGNAGAAQYLAHAINAATGAEQTGWPIAISGYADNASQIDAHLFHPRTQLQRPGLLLMNGVVYAAFGSSCDVTPWNGWIVGLSTATHTMTTRFVAVRDDNAGAGIWQAGSGLVSDKSGEILFSTGNGGFDLTGPRPGNQPPNDLSEAVARVVVQPNGTLKPVDFFAPYDSPQLEQNDLDFGSGGPVGLPDAYFGTTSHPHLLVMEGKQGYVYLLDRDNLGGYLQGAGGGDGVVDRIGPYGGVWSRPTVWPGNGGYVYFVTANGSGGVSAGASGFMRAYKYGVDGSGNPTLSLAASSTDGFGFGSGAPVITSNGTTAGSAVLWDVWEPDGTGTNAQLRAYDPVPVGGTFKLLWSAPIGTASKFSMPAVDNAHVYVGTRDGHVLAYWSPVSVPLTANSPTIPNTVVGKSSAPVKVTFTAHGSTTVTAFSSTDPEFTLGASTPATPTTLANGATISVPITFTPTKVGLSSTTLQATTPNGVVSLAVNAVGQSPTPKLVVSPTQLSLGGTTAGGAQLSGSVTLTNAGAMPLTLSATTFPAAGSQFKVTGVPPTGSKIAAGASITTNVTFTPAAGAASQQYNDAFTLHSDGGDQTVSLTAVVATSAQVSITPMTFNLGRIPIGSIADSSFILHNGGGLSAAFVRSKPPASNVGFTALTALPEGSTLAAGASLKETVRFTATKAGTFSDTWSLNPADGFGVRTVSFTATAVPSGEIPSPANAAWQLNGTAKHISVPTATTVQLTPPTGANVAGSAFYSKPLPSRYLHISFDAVIGGGSGADGMALVLADASKTTPKALGIGGGGLGYSGISGTAIALDTYHNSVNPSGNFVGVSTGPTAPGADLLKWVTTNSTIPPLEDVHDTPPMGYRDTHVDVQIFNGVARINAGGVVLPNLPVSLGAKVLVGFTGGSGGNTDEHSVTNVHVSLAAPDTTLTAHPAATTGTAGASFSFASTVGGSTFHCVLDNGSTQNCSTPHAVTVAPGAHTFRVTALDPNGVADRTPAVFHWTYAPASTQHGYWMLGSNGAVYPFGNAQALGSAPDSTVAHLTPTSSAHGYWIVNHDGHVYAFGDARNFGDATGLAFGEQVTTMSATHTSRGYWLFTDRGRVFAFGDAAFYGDLRNVALNGPVIDSVPTASGRGYYMVASDGGVFAFGDARFHGSLGATHLNQPIIGLVPTATGKGYWLDASDGGVFAFGDAPFRGSLGGSVLNRPIVGMVRFGNGYLLAGSDGGVFDFSSSPFLGSLGSRVPPAPIVGIAAFGR